MTFIIDHYGFVTHSIPDTRNVFNALFGFVDDGPEFHDSTQWVIIQFLRHADRDDCRIELLSPLTFDRPSPVTRLMRSGGGLHHICVRVASLDDFENEMLRFSFAPAKRPAIAPAFGGRRVAFATLPGLGLVEFVETADAAPLAQFGNLGFDDLRMKFHAFLFLRPTEGDQRGVKI